MQQHAFHRTSVARGIQSVAPCAIALLAGCEKYERQPLDLVAHRASFDQRAIEVGRLEDFVERLHQLGSTVPSAFAFEDGLTPEEGEVVALFYNPDLRLARLDAGVAEATFDNAGLWDDPEFRFDGAEIWNPSAPFEFGLGLTLTIPVSGRLEVEKARAGTAYEVELRRIVDGEWSTRARVRRAWAAWTTARERASLLRDVIAQIERIGAITDALEAVGELSRVEARLFRVELADRRAALAETELVIQREQYLLLALMGLPGDAGIDLLPAFPNTEPPVLEDPIGRLIESNTELAVRRAEYLVAEETLRLEIRKQYPDITIGGGYGSEDRDDRLLLGVAIPIPILNANRAAIAEARANRAVARGAAEITFDRLAIDLAAAQATLDAVRTQRAQYESEIVPMLADQSLEIEQIAALGEVDMLLLVDTVARQYDAKSRLLDLRLAELEATIAITQLLGPDATADPAPIGRAESDTDQDQSAAENAAGGIQ